MQPVAEGDNSSELEIMNKQNQDQHRKNQQQQQEAHEPQKCPRCESTNTKFCYYNNYSLSQPRYFCKTCRRYWTQGGTLRNVPIGGGCRKGKRAKTAASSSSSSLCSSSSSASSPSLHTVQVPPLPKVSDLAIASQYNYDGAAAAYLSSFAAIQTSSNQPQPFTRALIDSRSHQELFGVSSASSSSSSASASSAMSLLQGFSDISNSLCTVQRGQVYMTSNPSDPVSLINQSGNFARPNNGPISSSSQQDHWPPQSFNNMISKGASETAVWSIGTGNVRADNTSQSGPSLGPNQWPDLPRSYGSPPP